MEDLLNEITYEGVRPKDLLETTQIPRATLTRHLKELLDEGKIYKSDGVYRKYRKTPTVGDIYDKMMTYHQQNLMDFKYRKKPRDIQADLTLQWAIDTDMIIKGKISHYNQEELEENIFTAFNTFQRELNRGR